MRRLVLAADIEILGRTIYGEASGEIVEGKRAVGWALMNRWVIETGQFGKDDTLATACLRHAQFSAWNIGDPNFERLQLAPWHDPVLLECIAIGAQAVADSLAGRNTRDPVFGSTHYHTTAMGFPSTWGEPKPATVVIGWHSFYNNVK